MHALIRQNSFAKFRRKSMSSNNSFEIQEYLELEYGSAWVWNTLVLRTGIREYLGMEYVSTGSWNT